MKRIRVALLITVLAVSLNLTAASALSAQPQSQPQETASAQSASPAQASSAPAEGPTPVTSGAVSGDFLLLDVDGRLCVYEGEVLLMKTAIDINSLPASDRAALAAGIHADTSEELASYLEDFGA